MQATIRSAVTFAGKGLHSGAPATMTVHPASGDCGIWFRRTDLPAAPMIPALWSAVENSRLCTRISNSADISVSTIEHIMAALAGCGIHNALIDIDGPEVPILDGSSAQFVQGILSHGIQQLDAPVRAIEILAPVEIRDGDGYARLSPSDTFEIDFDIEFRDAAIGQQAKRLNMANGAFVKELCDSRTFCRQSDVRAMREDGLALGGTMSNAIVVDGDKVLTPGGMRYADEAVRHKMLDALGDLALAGAPLIGTYRGHKSGHSLTNRLLQALFARPDAYRTVICDAETALRLPGVGVVPADIPVAA